MQEMHVTSWSEFLDELKRLREQRVEVGKHYNSTSSAFLFRGQANACWKLETTLERETSKHHSFADYFRIVGAAQPQLETFTPNRWAFKELPELEIWARKYDNLKLTPFPGYDYLTYLRHHGFPSPLLDWTRSIYVAAYFAFESPVDDRVAIFVFWENTGLGKASSSNAPQIHTFGPHVRSHIRHFNQQSSYSICCEFESGEWKYTKHDLIYGSSAPTLQDVLYKFTIPASERSNVLASLDSMNINAFSLFQSEEALLRTISIREFLLREHEL